MKRQRLALSSRNYLRNALCILAAAAVVQVEAYAGGQPKPPLPCSVPPQIAAVSFFEFIEAPNGEENLRRDGPRVLSRTLMQTSSQRDIIGVLQSARQQYSFDKYEVPLSRRLAGEPQMLRQGQPGWNPRAQFSFRILALSSRGSVEQRVSLVCEDSVWKVVSFSYGPAIK
jgi:hypothetical protein